MWVFRSALILAASASAWAAPLITFNGEFSADNNVQLFLFGVRDEALVTVRTTSFAAGHFAPYLSLFDSTGSLLFWSDGMAENDCANNAIDSLGTGTCYDARISWTALSNELYTLALTQHHNGPIGPTLADGFFQNVYNPGIPNYTAADPWNAPGAGVSFLLPNYTVPGDQRGRHWSVGFESQATTLTAVALPEPSTSVLLLTGLALAVCRFRRSHT